MKRPEPYRFIYMIITALILSGCGEAKRAPIIHYGQHGGADSAGVHTVAAGDNLSEIAHRYDLSMQDIIIVNRLQAPYALNIGQRLRLPPPQTYTVKAGDTLYGVSRTFSVSQTLLARQNNLQSPYVIRQGETLRLPSVRGQRQSITTAQVDSVLPPNKPNLSARSVRGVSKKTTRTANKPINLKRPTPSRAGEQFLWPVDGPVLSSYGPKAGGLHNDGINIGARKGAPVKAAENGVVVYAGSELKGFGNLILVRHEDRWMTAYAHLDKILVKKGDVVTQGLPLGTVGSTGNVNAPQLHFEIRRGTDALNPQLYLPKYRI